MKPPSTYSEWVEILDRFGHGDDTLFEELNSGSFSLDAGTAHRFYLRVEEVYKQRKQKWVEKFQRSFQFQNLKTIDDFGIVLREGKQNLSPLLKFVRAKGLPDDLRNTLSNDLDATFNAIKKSLSDNVSKLSNNREKMLMVLNTFVLTENLNDPVKQNHQTGDVANNQFLPTGRKIIF